MQKRDIICWDLETDELDIDILSPVQIAAVIIDGKTLEITDRTFNMFVCPPDITDDDYLERHYKTIKWHANLKNTTPELIIEQWKKGVPLETAWKSFAEFTYRFNPKKTLTNALIPAGQNIIHFDLPVADRLSKQYNTKHMFWKRDAIDLKNYCYAWFENLYNGPINYKLDTLLDYFNMSSEGAHDALTDVNNCAMLITRFMRLHRRLAPKVLFKL